MSVAGCYQSYEAYLELSAREQERAQSQSQRPAIVIGATSASKDAAGTDAESSLADSLFFVDSAGGEVDAVSTAASSKKKRSKKKAAAKTQETQEAAAGKRKRDE